MNQSLRGILMMTAGISVLSVMDGFIKWLVLRDITSVQIIAVRGWIITVILLAIIALLPKMGGMKALKTPRWHYHLGRSLGGVFAPALFFVSLKYIPLADAVTIFFCSTFLMVGGSAIFLNEKVGIHRWSAVVVGFIGVVIALQPGTASFQPASILVLLAGISYAFILISGRWLSKTESQLQLIFYFTFFNCILCSIVMVIFWSSFWHDLMNVEFAVLALLSVIALTGYFFITRAFFLAPISVIAPIEYVSLFWAILIGYLVWNETPTPLVWLGIGIILTAGLYIAHRESKLKTEDEIVPVLTNSK